MTKHNGVPDGTAAAGEPHPSAGLGLPELLRCRVSARFGRLTRWEFWPAAVIYGPLLPYIAWLGLRYGGLTTCTLANPGMPLGGMLGESKWNILRALPCEFVVPTALIAPGHVDQRVRELQEVVESRGWEWPLVLKPDVGERGRDVEYVAGLDHARAYLSTHQCAVLAQVLHPGPFEAGVFYVRHPSEPHGRIFSITDKRFACVVGDGRSTLHALIWRHPRYRLQARTFLAALGSRANHVPQRGEIVTIGRTGNHCRGALFLDGAHLVTPDLTKVIDAISRRTPGFYFGRFDIRYSNESEFKAGRSFQIVELNGLLSESTNIYDPGTSFWQAQRVLREQWRLAYEIGAAHRTAHAAPHLITVLRSIGRALRCPRQAVEVPAASPCATPSARNACSGSAT